MYFSRLKYRLEYSERRAVDQPLFDYTAWFFRPLLRLPFSHFFDFERDGHETMSKDE